MMRLSAAIIFLALFSSSLPARCAELVVPGDFATIQEAIDKSGNGDVVTVLDGVYTGPGNRDIDFQGKVISIRSRNGPQNCLIDCRGTANEPHRGFYLHRGEGEGAVIEGFTISNGYAERGGGIYCNGSPTIRGNIIRGNTAVEGGGICCYEGGMIVGNLITENQAKRGGGIFTWEDMEPSVINNVINRNRAELSGGGIAVFDNSPSISGNLIVKNESGQCGGGLYLQSSAATLTNNTIFGNSADRGGGICAFYGISPISVRNTIIWGNLAPGGGGQIFAGDGSSITLNHCCLPEEREDLSGSINPGPGCVRGAPGWVDIQSGDCHLKPSSPCVDKGDNAYAREVNLECDLDGDPRFVNNDIDVGAYEYQKPAASEHDIFAPGPE